VAAHQLSIRAIDKDAGKIGKKYYLNPIFLPFAGDDKNQHQLNTK